MVVTRRRDEPTLLAEDFRSWWRAHAPEHLRDLDPDSLPDPDYAEVDAAAVREIFDRQAHAKNVLWRERLPRAYADARLDLLRPHQDPEHRVSRWLDTDALGLLLAGPAGHGKTYAAYAVGNASCADGVHALAWTLADLNAAMRPGATEPERTYERAVACDLLLIDDLGREQVTAWSLEVLQRLLDARLREHRRTITTTNSTYEQVVERYGTPIADRLVEAAVIVRIEGERMRTAAPW